MIFLNFLTTIVDIFFFQKKQKNKKKGGQAIWFDSDLKVTSIDFFLLLVWGEKKKDGFWRTMLWKFYTLGIVGILNAVWEKDFFIGRGRGMGWELTSE